MSDQETGFLDWQLLTVIVNNGVGSKVLKVSRKAGITGGTILLGHGASCAFKKGWVDDCDVRKEIVLMISDTESIAKASQRLCDDLKLNKPDHGIAFIMSICALIGVSSCRLSERVLSGGEKATMQKAIFVIVEKGVAETVVEAAEKAGARGATIINARGAGRHETSKLFSLEIEPEKEIVLIIDDAERMSGIAESIRQAIELDNPGKGILFGVDIDKAYGLFKG